MPLEGIYDFRLHEKEFLKKRKDSSRNFDGFSNPHWFELPWSVEMLKEIMITKFPQLQKVPMPSFYIKA